MSYFPLLFLCLILMPVGTQAHLKAQSDHQLSSVTGQAFVTMARYRPGAG